MSMFSKLMHSIFDRAGPSQASAAPASPPPAQSTSGQTSTQPTAAPSTPTAQPSSTQAGTQTGNTFVDVSAVLNDLASKNSEKLDWKRSIVDLMKLVGMDSSLSARKELAQELGYTGSTDGSAEMNTWLHKQVMKKLAENGGKVPAELR